MNLSQQSIHDVIHPTAALARPTSSASRERSISNSDWSASFLNPKNRIDSLEPVRNSKWRIDGCTAYGSQFYAVPVFFDTCPLRIDVFVPELTTLPEAIRRVLDVDVVFHTRDADRIAGLGITRHILRILNYWTSTLAAPRAPFDDVPFGSRIVLANLPVNIRDVSITIAPAHYVERHLVPLADLQANWGAHLCYPPTVDVRRLKVVFQVHDSVCLVELDQKLWILKALANHTKYLYHELRNLLRIPPHENVVAKPSHLVTKACSFGGKTAVLGFTLEYHEYGSLRDLVPFLHLHHQITTETAVGWSVQLTSALCHLRQTTGTFYPDLRLDNIVLSADGRVVMVDFEQRGVWCEFAAPEVNAFDYVRIVAIDGDTEPCVQQQFADILEAQLPGWHDLEEGEEYIWPSSGYNVAWKCLTPTEQEACEVYMLGRVLWCIFEGQSAPQRATVWISYRWEPELEFPEYRKAPQPIRDLIDRCTRGRSPGMGTVITRRGSQLVLRSLERTGGSTPEDVQQTAKEWWQAELKRSRDWLRARAEGLRRGDWNENFYNRPRLREVYDALKEYQQSNNFGHEPHLVAGLKQVLGGIPFCRV
ncbi:hypothetical protein NLU13_2342 [Sarocladium strictum]|uniref:Protein kinase domain-containing protein n=1 Tax=Sarocladium strictum TaxID=5046 RepID=A0AA39GH20_SARSR|nr:hypothetical protein NLU13_5132 [Sarocladium strictum]KAK0392848.1 hypothetical protein NLU13_2342 [Sarocladium strictum]